MRQALAVFLSLPLAFPAVLFAHDVKGFESRLTEAAAKHPEEAFAPPKDVPPQLLMALKAQGYPDKKFTNRETLALYRGLIPKTPGAGGEESEKKKSGKGLRILGIDMGGGNRDPISDDNEAYLRKGLPQLLDWDIRARVALDGLGASAKYRHPEGMRSFSLGLLKYFDVPNTIGLDHARDSIYHAVGGQPEKPFGGFELGASGALNPYVGGATIYDHRQAQQVERIEDKTKFSVEAGYSPLGDNPGKSWNYTLLPSVNFQGKKIDDGAYHADVSGLGFNVGVAWQQALHQLPLPGVNQANTGFWLDRLKVRFDSGYNAVTGAAFALAAELSVRVFTHLELTGGAKMTLYPSPDRNDPKDKVWDPAAIVGIDLHY